MWSALPCHWEAVNATLSRSHWCSVSPCSSSSSTTHSLETASVAPSSVSQLTFRHTNTTYSSSITTQATNLSVCCRNPLLCVPDPLGVEHAGIHGADTIGKWGLHHFLLLSPKAGPRKHRNQGHERGWGWGIAHNNGCVEFVLFDLWLLMLTKV